MRTVRYQDIILNHSYRTVYEVFIDAERERKRAVLQHLSTVSEMMKNARTVPCTHLQIGIRPGGAASPLITVRRHGWR